jgi:hypothetical protein
METQPPTKTGVLPIRDHDHQTNGGHQQERSTGKRPPRQKSGAQERPERHTPDQPESADVGGTVDLHI